MFWSESRNKSRNWDTLSVELRVDIPFWDISLPNNDVFCFNMGHFQAYRELARKTRTHKARVVTKNPDRKAREPAKTVISLVIMLCRNGRKVE